ncbi:hypothetical protein F4861DRAFT_511550 [Xylaria intraflava]|nr:hypothetical protein F4861DRAFT_511550 [Xylaria intraflava]
MDDTRKHHFRDHKPISLDDYLEKHISAAKEKRLFSAFSLSVCDDNFRIVKAHITVEDASLWTYVILIVDGIVDECKAMRILRAVDEGMDKELSTELKPQQVAYLLFDDSNTRYQAKSYMVRGERPARHRRHPYHGSEDDEDWVPTQPATPTESDPIELEFKILNLKSDVASLQQ